MPLPIFPFDIAVANDVGGGMKIDAPLFVLHIDDADAYVDNESQDDKLDLLPLKTTLTHFDYYQTHQVA